MSNDATEVAPGLWRANKSASIFATEAHRALSSFAEAVQEWNARTLTDGWRSAYAPQLPCPSCGTLGILLTTIYGATKGTCSECEHRWHVG